MEGVFARNGQGGKLHLVADWNELYREHEDPWEQSGKTGEIASYYALSRGRLTKAIQRHVQKPGTGIEVGCGHGVVLKHLGVYCSNITWEGVDISDVAIEHAARVNSKFKYFVGDLLNIDPAAEGRYEVVVVNQMLWYVIHELSKALANARAMLKPDGILIVSQAFLREEQKYAADIADGFHGLLDFLRNYQASTLRLIECCYDDRGLHLHHDGLFVMRRLG